MFDKLKKSKYTFGISTGAMNLIMAICAVLPMMLTIYRKVRFTYEVNDDAALVQVLDGSYTGTPDGHSIFVHFPLSGVIARLYEMNPTVDFCGIHIEDANWYIVTFAAVTTIALIAVLFRLLCYVGRFRIILCLVFDMMFVIAWMPHFSCMTFSTAAGFMAVMGVLYYGLLRPEEAWRPWNVITFAFLMICAYSYREPCFLMALPFIGVETVFKFGIRFFKSWKPWVCAALAFLLIFGAMKYDDSMYGTQRWQDYRAYNSQRAHLTDYVGYPDYDTNKDFYDSIGMNHGEYYAMTHYSYSLVDGYGPSTLKKVYDHVHAQEETSDVSTVDRLLNARGIALEYYYDNSEFPEWMIKVTPIFWMLAVVLLALSVLWYYRSLRRRCWGHLANFLTIVSYACIVMTEWMYLAADGRFPERVEEVIRLLTLYVGFYVAMRVLGMWHPQAYPEGEDDSYLLDLEPAEDKPFWQIFFKNKVDLIASGAIVVAEILLVVCVINGGTFDAQVDSLSTQQEAKLSVTTNKTAVITYCGQHEDNYYVLDNGGVTDGNSPYDDTHQGNWFLSGSWMNFSPVYYEKLNKAGTNTLSHSFLARENVYLITRGEKDVARSMGYDDKNSVSYTITDRFTVPSGNEYIVYKVR